MRGAATNLQAKEDLALHLQAFIQKGLQVAAPLNLLAQAGCLLAHLGLSLHQLLPNLPVARVGMRCLIPLKPVLHTLHQATHTLMNSVRG